MTTPYEQNARRTLAQHAGHLVTVNGGTDRIVTTSSLEGDNVMWNYGGFVVDCVTCGENLSQQW